MPDDFTSDLKKICSARMQNPGQFVHVHFLAPDCLSDIAADILFSDSNNIILWHKSEDIKGEKGGKKPKKKKKREKKAYFQNFS